MLKEVPAVGLLEDAVIESPANAAGLTVIALDVPVNVPLNTVIVWLPEVFSVTENVPVPFVSAPPAGNTALASELVN